MTTDVRVVRVQLCIIKQNAGLHGRIVRFGLSSLKAGCVLHPLQSEEHAKIRSFAPVSEGDTTLNEASFLFRLGSIRKLPSHVYVCRLEGFLVDGRASMDVTHGSEECSTLTAG